MITYKNDAYLTFCSFWGGLKITKLNKNRLPIAEPIEQIKTIATRVNAEGMAFDKMGNLKTKTASAIEAPFIFKKDKYYYLFASMDYCCKGPKSTYKMIVGRAKKVTGPYRDQAGIRMDRGGGSILLTGNESWYGVGHNGICSFNGDDYLVYHGYDAADNGKSKLIINKIDWQNEWPVVLNQANNLAAPKEN